MDGVHFMICTLCQHRLQQGSEEGVMQFPVIAIGGGAL